MQTSSASSARCTPKEAHTARRCSGCTPGRRILFGQGGGAGVSYGLGSDNQSLPAFITISPPRGHGGVQNYGAAFLPAMHQGTAIGSAEIPIAKAVVSNLGNQRLKPTEQREQLDLIQSLNRQ